MLMQDYITSVEAMAEDQKRELQRVKEEKSQIERVRICEALKREACF